MDSVCKSVAHGLFWNLGNEKKSQQMRRHSAINSHFRKNRSQLTTTSKNNQTENA